ncbi:MAG: thioredoxin-dependent thiol peroxidase [Verrucomicrobiae bacterium]|nr:thioredoxin-dependent thiol peroxidase [Verrucomicrobiae bacterium]
MKELKVGDKAPSFAELEANRGKTVVLYFYPKDFTPGCTQEACEFRDAHEKLRRRGAVVLGISPDSNSSHAKFAAEHKLPFTLVADEDHRICEAYGVWKEKSMYGKKYMGVERSTFLIGPDGRITKIWRKVKPQGHADEVLAALAS